MDHLHALDLLVTHNLSVPFAPSSVHLKALPQLLDNAIDLSVKLRPELLQQALTNRDKKQMKVFVQTFQAVCIDICNKLNWDEKELALPGADKKVLKVIMQKNKKVQENLLSLLRFIQHHFPSYFDSFQVMPVLLAKERSNELQARSQHLLHVLSLHLDPALVQVLVAPVDAFLKLQNRVHQSYTRFDVLDKYLELLSHIFENPVEDRISALMYGCIEIGYSPKEFVFHYLDHIRSVVCSLPEEDRWNIISRHLKTIEFLPAPDGSIVSASLKTAIIKSLREEINGVQQPHLSANNTQLPKMEGKPLQTPMSVAQLGLFIRLLVESGTIKCDNHSLLLRMIASSFKTNKTVAISPESLRIKYYATDPASVSIVKEYVIRMMNHLITCK